MSEEETNPSSGQDAPEASGGAGSPGDAAADALRAAQEAIANLQSDAGMSPAAPTAKPGAGAPEVSAQAKSADDDAEAQMMAALAAAQAAIDQAKADNPMPSPAAKPPAAPVGPVPSPFNMPDIASAPLANKPENLNLLGDVNLNVKVELGRTRMLVEDVLRLGPGAVVELDKLAGDPVDIYVNDRAVARGEVLVLNDNFCVRVNEILGDGLDKKK